MTDFSGGFGSRRERREAERRAAEASQSPDATRPTPSGPAPSEASFESLIAQPREDGLPTPSSGEYQPLDISKLSREELERISAQAVIDARPPQYLVDSRSASQGRAPGVGAASPGGYGSTQTFAGDDEVSKLEPEAESDDLNTLFGLRSPASSGDRDGQFLSRRQLRAQQQTAELPPEVLQPASPQPVQPQPEPSEPAGTIGTGASSLVREPQTNSIVISAMPDALSIPLSLSETVTAYPTGSIEIPSNMSNPATGEISVISDADETDTAQALDSKAAYVSTIAPVRATGVIKSSTKLGVVPVKVKRGQGQLYLVLTTAIMMVTVGGLLAVAFILGVFE